MLQTSMLFVRTSLCAFAMDAHIRPWTSPIFRAAILIDVNLSCLARSSDEMEKNHTWRYSLRKKRSCCSCGHPFAIKLWTLQFVLGPALNS
jgi:hypothetical protein